MSTWKFLESCDVYGSLERDQQSVINEETEGVAYDVHAFCFVVRPWTFLSANAVT